ncbi:MAG: putative zinc protease AlbF [Candidatus Cloacimonetes bacterium ADurb.Bin089]|nr:MAG: putative zinc protease AlbF [Candidatus Cloacimonetes bacterium ADurb.Bin089]
MRAFKLPQPVSKILPNGLEVISVQDNSNAVLCLQLYIRTGSVQENKNQRGYSHFIEHLSFKSTRDFPFNGISRYASGLGGMLNAFTDFDCTCYYLMLPSEKLQEGLHILAELGFQSTFSKEDVATEKDIILEEIKQYQNDPETDFLDYIQSTYYQKSPLKYPILGNPESVSQADFAALRRFYRQRYIPENSFLVICGDFHYEELNGFLDKYFVPWKKGNKPIPQPTEIEPEINGLRYFWRQKEINEKTLALALPELCDKHPLANALLIAIRYLAIGKSSRLYKRLVEEEKICSSVKVSSLCGILSGASVISFTPLSDKYLPDIVHIFKEELSFLLKNGIPANEMALIKKDIIHSWLFSFEGMEDLAGLVATEKLAGDLTRLQSYDKEIDSTPLSSVMKAIHKYWLPAGLAVYYQSPDQNMDLMQEANSLINITQPINYPSSIASLADEPSLKLDFLHLKETKSTKTGKIIPISENFYTLTLSNGMPVLFKQLKNKNISGFSLSSYISQICETPSEIGSNFFCSSLLLYQTQKHSHQELQHYSRENGFNIRLIHHLDTTTFRGKCQKENLDKALSMLAEILYLPRFDRNYFSLLTSAALDEIRRDQDYPVNYAYLNWYKMLVGKQSNLFRSSGTPGQIRSLHLKDLQQWYERWNIGRDFCLAVVGNYQPEEVLELCEQTFGIAQAEKQALIPHPLYSPESVHFKKIWRKTDQAIIYTGGFASPASNREENTAFYVLAQILGGDISSRFFDILREKYGYAYQTGFDFHSLNELGFWNAYAFCDKSDYRNCLSLMQEILYSLVDRGVEEEELENAKRYLIGMNRFENESVSYTASSLSNLSACGFEPEYYLSREDRIHNVDKEIIRHIAKKWLLPENQYTYLLW